MLSPSHPGPHKATHLTMCDRTLLTTLVASTLPLPIVVVVSNSVGVKCRASATDDRADDCTLLTTHYGTHCRTCSGANRRGQLIASCTRYLARCVPTPERASIARFLQFSRTSDKNRDVHVNDTVRE